MTPCSPRRPVASAALLPVVAFPALSLIATFVLAACGAGGPEAPTPWPARNEGAAIDLPGGDVGPGGREEDAAGATAVAVATRARPPARRSQVLHPPATAARSESVEALERQEAMP